MAQRPLTEYRSLFPVHERAVYLNHAGVAPTSTLVRAAVLEWLDGLISAGVAGEADWEARSTEVRARAARLIGADPAEIAFVRSTSHGLGLVAEGIDWAPGDEVAVCAAVEYPSNVYPWRHLSGRGVVVREFEPERGGVTAPGLATVLGPRTRLVAVSSVQYATGHRTDLAAIGRLCREAGALLVVDAIQSVGAFALDVRAAGIDFLSADSHKWLLGLNGIGFLFVARERIPDLRPVLVGWKSTTDAWNFDRVHFELSPDANRYEEGSPSYLGIYGLGAALALLEEVGVDRISARITELLTRLESGLADLPCTLTPAAAERAGILTIGLEMGGEAELATHLEGQGFAVGCRRGRLRISPHFYNTDDEIDRLVDAIRHHLA